MISKKKSIPILIIILISILTPIIPVWGAWLTGWDYRKSHTITGSTVGAQTDYQVGIKVYYGAGADGTEAIDDITFGKVYLDSKSMVDFGDVRFTQSDGTSLLDFWIEEKVNSDYAIIWVEVNAIPISPNTVIIYIYYGKAAETTTSHGDNTFPLLFDEFNSLDAGTWTWTAGVSVAGGILTVGITNRYIRTDNLFAHTSEIALRCYVEMDSGNLRWNQGFAETWGASNDFAISHNQNNHIHANIQNGGSTTGQVFVSTYFGNVYVKTEMRLIEVSDELEIMWDGNVASASAAASYPDESMYIGFQTWGSSQDALNVDWCLVRKFVDPEPTHTAWGAEELENVAPTITSASIPDRDDGDNCYEMESYYSLIAVVNDGDGAIQISDVYIQGKQGGAVRFEVRGTNLDGVPSYSIQAGATIIDIDAGSCSWVENGNEGTLTIKIRFEWDFTDEINLEIAVYVEDALGASAGFTVMQTDYFDVLGRIVISSLAVTDGRIDRNTATTFSGNANYATTIGGNTPSVKYPPDAQWTAVHIHDSAHVSKGNDAIIVNGVFSGISVTIPDAVQSNTYHVYLDLVPDYSDGDAPDGDTIAVIGDQIEIVSVAFPDSRININTASEVRYVLRYDFDDVAFEGADGSIIGFTWDAGNSWWDKSVTSPANPGHDVYDEHDLGALTDNTHGLTVYEDDAGSNLVGDRIKVLTLTANVTARLINEYIQLRLTAELEYDNHPLGAGDSVEINGTVFSWDAGDSRFEVDVTRAIAQILLYNTLTDGTEATYGITIGNIDGNNVTIVFYEGISILFGAGFNASTPFVELHWNHSLALMDFFEVQNSSDRSSWTYLGQNTTTEYVDLQVVNGTERYYRIRTCLFTDGQWYNGSFSYVNFEKVYFISTEAGPAGPAVESDFPWLAIAIALSIIVLLLSWLKHGD